MIITVSQLIKDSMGLVNALEMDETPPASEMATNLRAANAMLGRWAAQRLLLRAGTSVAFNTVADTADYSIAASGADITAAKPLSVQSGILKDGTLTYGLTVYPKQQFDRIGDRDAVTARPTIVTYDPGAAQQAVHTGTFWLYPTPDKVYAVTLEVDTYLTELVNLTDNFVMEPVYYEAFIYGLAARLHRRYNSEKVPVPADIAQIASNALDNLRTLNSVRVSAQMDLPGIGGSYNVLTDGYN
jgi:hypothetical protein